MMRAVTVSVGRYTATAAAALLLLITTLNGFHGTVLAQTASDENPFFEAAGLVFDPDIDNVDARSGVIASAIFAYLPSFSPSLTFGDATLLIWTRSIRLAAQFDATAPFHPTAVGIYTRLPRQEPPSAEDELRVFNTAVLHASYHVLLHLMPVNEPEWRLMMNLTGLDADDDSVCTLEDTDCTPEAIGNAAGLGVVESKMFSDGFNWDGLMGRTTTSFPQRAADYTGYKPVNSAYDLDDAGRWQPTITENQVGVYKIQQFVTPQFALTEPYAPGSVDTVEFEAPVASDPGNEEMYRAQADAVILASGELTAEKKLNAEFFDNKGIIFGFPILALRAAADLSPFERLHADFIEAAAAHDAGVAVWTAKRKYDAVRPFSAIRKLYANENVRAYGGPGFGTIDDLPGQEWQSYMPTADHPEYPSATACFCAAVAEGWRSYFGTDTLDFSLPQAPGASIREPGITPEEATEIGWQTLTQYTEDCAQSRVDGGTHFPFAVEQSMAQCPKIGSAVHEWVQRLIDGTEPERDPFTPPIIPETVGPNGGGGGANGQ